jgi:hypothetical protein
MAVPVAPVAGTALLQSGRRRAAGGAAITHPLKPAGTVVEVKVADRPTPGRKMTDTRATGDDEVIQ